MKKTIYYLALIITFMLSSSCSINKNNTIKEIVVVDISVINCIKPYTLHNDTLSKLAKTCDTSIDNLLRLNNITSASSIKTGQTIYLSKQAKEKYPSIKAVKTKKSSIKQKNTKSKILTNKYLAKKVAKNKKWVMPVDAKINKKFNRKKGNLGLGFATKKGQKVYTIADGTVVYSGDKMLSHGKMIIIRHPLNFYSSYTQNGELLVQDGENVKIGDVIAITSKNNFYMEMRKMTKPVNPTIYIK